MVKYFIAGVILFLFSCNQKTSSENEKEKIINNDLSYEENYSHRFTDFPLSVDSLFKILHKLGKCANVTQVDWDKYYENDVMRDFQCRCSMNNLDVYPLMKNSDSIFLVEIKVNHGSGEYDNFIIQKFDTIFKNVQSFKAYIDTTYKSERLVYNIKCRKIWNPNTMVQVIGKWKMDGFYQDSIVEYYINDSLDPFTNISKMIKHFSNKEKWDG